MIRLMTHGFEVRDKSLKDWENSILQGYYVWRQLVAQQGGVFVGDAENGTVGYEPIAVE
jgi:hypothetical protein